MTKRQIPSLLIALAVVIAISALLVWLVRSREIRESGLDPQTQPPREASLPLDPVTQPGLAGNDGGAGRPGDGLRDLSPLRGAESPEALVREMANALNESNMEEFSRLAGGQMDPGSLEALRRFAAQQRALGRRVEVREVGETDLDAGSRWALEGGRDGESTRFYLDMRKGEGGWMLENLIPPGTKDDAPAADDALAAAEAFLLAVLSQDFESARLHVDGRKVSDARIAGLCILFEEGRYALRREKPLRLLVKRGDLAAYLANVVASDGSETAQFGLNLHRHGDPAKWVVNEVNLDRLLADYAQRVAGGDVHYSPLVRNPEGGETLALYFGFDEDEINPRTRRQLEIVAAILRADPVKKLTLSGHTDSKGSDDYNRGLSRRRAEAVKDFLLAAGVQAPQVVTLAKGDSEPRRPNVTETGEDNPEGRRANRRTEIYLDF